MMKASLTVILLMLMQISFAQYQIGLVPRVSPDRAVYQKIGYTEVQVKYGSPAVKNREIWGELVPYGQLWRAGANNATTVELSDAITVDHNQLDSGKYALFIIPKEGETWTVIFNKVHKQWGASGYDEKNDALRVEVKPGKAPSRTENLTYSIRQLGYQHGSIVLQWDDIELEIPFETSYLTRFQQKVETRASDQPEYLQWIVYLQGADHLEQIDAETDVALLWINQAEQVMQTTEEWNEQFYPRDYVKGHLYWTKAKLLAKTENYSEAGNYAQRMKALQNTIFYDRKSEAEDIDTQIELWTRK